MRRMRGAVGTGAGSGCGVAVSLRRQGGAASVRKRNVLNRRGDDTGCAFRELGRVALLGRAGTGQVARGVLPGFVDAIALMR